MSSSRLLLSLVAVLSVGATVGAPLVHATSLAASPSALPAPGRVTGIVTDSTSGETLIGATVRVAGTSIGTATDIDGRFSILGVPSGPQTLTVSYIGYDDKTVQVVVPDGGSLTVDVALAYSVGDALGEVTVTAQTQGQLAAINQQLNSNTIVNIVSSDRIRELPDNNAAESIGRLPGIALERSAGEANKVIIRGLAPKYSTVLVNGVRVPSTDSEDRSVDLTTITPESLAAIEVFKAIPANFEADAIGGTVNLRLRTAPTGLHGYGSVQTGYNQVQNSFGNYRFYGSASNRFMGDRLGLIAGLNLEKVDRSSDRFNGEYGINQIIQDVGGVADTTYNFLTNSLRVSEDLESRHRYGGSLVADYRYPSGVVTFNTFLSRRESDITYRQNALDTIRNNETYVIGRRPNNQVDLSTSALNVLQRLGALEVDATASFARSVNNSPNNREWVAEQKSPFQSGIDRRQVPIDSLQAITDINLDDTNLVNVSIFDQRSREDEATIRAELSYPLSFGSAVSGTFKVGGMLRNRDRSFDRTQQSDNLLLGGGQIYRDRIGAEFPDIYPDGRPGQILLAPFLDPTYDPGTFLNGDYSLGFTSRLDLLNRLADAVKDTLRFDAGSSFAGDYTGSERYRAGYAMAELKLGSIITFVPGLRYEKMNTEYTGYIITDRGGFPTASTYADADTTVARSNDYFFPQLLLTARPTDWLTLRAAKTRTLTRPDYNQITPRLFVPQGGDFIQQSNPFITPAVSSNYDLAGSISEQHVGLFSAGYFHKNVTGFINVSDTFLIDDCNLQGFSSASPCSAQIPGAQRNARINLPVNNPFDATISGVELDLQTSLWYLPSYLRGIVLNLNYTRINTATRYQFFKLNQEVIFEPEFEILSSVTDSSRAGSLPSQPNDIVNVALGYDLGGFSSRLSLQYIAGSVSSVNASQTANSRLDASRLRVDFSGRQRLPGGLEVYLNVNNLTSLSDQTYLGNTTLRPTFAEYYGLTGDLGLRYRF